MAASRLAGKPDEIGDPSGLSSSPGSILLGDDLDVRGWTVARVIGKTGAWTLSPERSGTVQLVLERQKTDGSQEEVRLSMSPAVWEALGEMYNLFHPGRRDDQGSTY